MAWQLLFNYPLSTELFRWVYSSNPNSYEPNAWTSSNHFLVKLVDYQLDNTFVNTQDPNYQPRSYFFSYCQIAEWGLSDINGNSTSNLGSKKYFKPALELLNQNVELLLPYTQKIDDPQQGRIIAVRRLSKRYRPNRYINHLNDDRMSLNIYHWI